MRLFRWTLVAVGACAAPAHPGPSATPVASNNAERPVASTIDANMAPRTVDELKDRIVEQINAASGKGLVDLYGPRMREAFPVERTTSFVQEVHAAKGQWRSTVRVPGEDSSSNGTWRVQAERGEWVLEIHMDADGRVAGLKITPPPGPPVVRNEVPIDLPFKGQWLIVWGGDTVSLNHHLNAPSQRRAADLAMVDAQGRTHRGDGRSNLDYFAYGQEVLSVADGTVVTAIDGVPENEPGSLNPDALFGNVVIVRHAPTLYSVYAHLQPGHIRVKMGMQVRAGAPIGLCGNSGNSSEPHLHFQLQDGPDLRTSWGVEASFREVLIERDGKSELSKGYVFFKGDRVRPGP